MPQASLMVPGRSKTAGAATLVIRHSIRGKGTHFKALSNTLLKILSFFFFEATVNFFHIY